MHAPPFESVLFTKCKRNKNATQERCGHSAAAQPNLATGSLRQQAPGATAALF